MTACIVLVTCPPARAKELAEALVTEQLAGCVNILGPVSSVYRWEGKVEVDEESLLIIKTNSDTIGKLETRVLQLHPYDTPEFVVVDAAHVEPRYAAWLEGTLLF